METKNLCAQIPLELHAKVRAEQEKSGLTLGAYITDVLTQFYEKGEVKMNEPTRTLAFQIPDEMFWRIKDHLARETERTGKKLSQKDFVLGLIEKALEESESAEDGELAEVSNPDGSEDNGNGNESQNDTGEA